MRAEVNPAQCLHALGQSLWGDSINRVSGALAHIRALERPRAAGLDLTVPSVASLFISRWDVAADPMPPPARHGGLGLAMAQKTYSSNLQLLADRGSWRPRAIPK